MIFRTLLIGIFVLAAWLPSLPSLMTVALLAVALTLAGAALLCSRWRERLGLRTCQLLVLGWALLWAMGWGQWQLQHRLPTELEGVDLQVSGRIAGLVTRKGDVQRFDFFVHQVTSENGEEAVRLPRRLRLSIYHGAPVAAGEGWRFTVRLKHPHGFANPGGFDYERWLLARGIDATGYVRGDQWQRLPQLDSHWQRWRAQLRQQLLGAFGEGRVTAVLSALSLGDRSLLAAEESRFIQQLGLSHLLAISGLHIGFAAAVGLLLGRWLGGLLSLWWPLRFFGPRVGLVLAVVVALLYGALSGLSLATQRALIMLLVGVVWYWSYRRYSAWLSWWLAMVLILLWQPLAILEAGFWFSFVAVAVLIALASGAGRGLGSRLWLLIKLQCCLFLAMGVLQWFLGMPVSLVSPLVNLLAVPYISLLVVPVILLALLASPLLSVGHNPLWWLAERLLAGFWWGLEQWRGIGDLLLFTPQAQVSPWLLGLSAVGLTLLLLPLHWSTRSLGALPLLALAWPAVPQGAADSVTVLDVGQGLAVVAGSHDRWLLYDAGPAYDSGFDTGAMVVNPYLFARGIRGLQTLVVSHGDLDHSGGAAAVAEQRPVTQWWLGEPLSSGMPPKFDYCHGDRQWRLGDWQVRLIGNGGHRRKTKSNDRSCVVLLEQGSLRILLPGDIGRQRERELLQHPALQQPVTVMVVPHHGSQSSSSPAWLDRLQPQWVVFSAGYRNRYRHPHQEVVARYRQRDSWVLSTASSGAVSFARTADGGLQVYRFRQHRPRYWRRRDAADGL